MTTSLRKPCIVFQHSRRGENPSDTKMWHFTPLCKKSHPLFPSSFFPVCFLLLLTLNTSLLTLLVTKYVGGFSSHQAILYTTSRASYNFTQLWYSLPGYSVRSHRLRAQSHKTAATPLQMPIASSGSPGFPQLLSNLAKKRRFLWPPPQV